MDLYLVVADAPDLDFIPDLLVGDTGRYHHGITRSMGFAAFFGFVFSMFLYLHSSHTRFTRLTDVEPPKQSP